LRSLLKIFRTLKNQRDLQWFWAGFVLAALGASPASAISPQLLVSGNQILTNGGCTIRLRGVNVDSLEFSNTGNGPPSGGITATVAESVTAWQSTLVRIPLSQDFWFGCTNSKVGNFPVNGPNYQALVSDIVNYCNAQGAYVLLDLHWSGTNTGANAPCGGGWGNATAQQYMPDDNSVTFWSSVAALYANNPAVLFDLYNEPFDYDGNGWNIWRDGGQGASYAFHTPGMQALLNTVRSAGATNVVVLGGLDYAYDLSQVNSFPLTNVGSGIIYSSHIYPFKGSNPWTTADGNNKIAPAAGNHPILIGEFGQNAAVANYVPNPDTNGTWDQALLNWIDLHGFSATAWDMHTGSAPILISNWSFTPTSYHGVPVKNWLATPVPTCFFTPTPTLTLTPCGYPGNTCTPTDTPTATDTPTPTNTPYPSNNIVWPNPWDGSAPLTFYHTISQPVDLVRLKLYTLAFRKVYEDDSQPTSVKQQIYTLDWNKIGNVANGLYYLVVDEVRGRQETQQVIKLLIHR